VKKTGVENAGVANVTPESIHKSELGMRSIVFKLLIAIVICFFFINHYRFYAQLHILYLDTMT